MHSDPKYINPSEYSICLFVCFKGSMVVVCRFGVIFLHANKIIMSALSGYQKQAFISSRDVVGFAL